ncbi:hypothetical protein [Pseudomonas sp. MWU12-2323]|uniref:hypothetical protein n=1 Tax=Pseudomonas sp. MWU12-2323 TaxID=2651296 RepID=UPI00128BD0B4|nr:hypothetical protein [Pseudomonas sp. MWU12-2323]MPQ71487.1 hypothetical protein [Pseudomonas sp. MWU12-2323]
MATSRYILGHLSYSEIAVNLKDDQEAVIVLNPAEPTARHEVAKNMKAAFIKVGRRCVVRSQNILVEEEPGTWKQSHFMFVKPAALDHV